MSASSLGGEEGEDADYACEFLPALVSSPGKVIINGEHAVVYGKPAIATSVNLRCYLLLVPTRSGHVTLDLPSLHLTKSWPVDEIAELLGCAEDEHLSVLRKYCGMTENSSINVLASLVVLYLMTHIMRAQLRSLHGLDITVSSELPFGAGLGSSAAYSVCVAAGLLSSIGAVGRTQGETEENRDLPRIPDMLQTKATDCGLAVGGTRHCFSSEDLRLIDHWGFEAEKLVHGTPSGIDNSISVYGGAIRFQAGKFTTIERMPNLSILLVHTKVPRSTKKIVSAVRHRYETYPEVISPILNSIEELVKRAEGLLHEIHKTGEWPDCSQHYLQLQELLVVNHQLLNALGAGHQALDRVCHIARETGGLGAKLTGAGGGGCAIVLLTPDTSQEKLVRVKLQLQECGFDLWETSIGSKGVLPHWSSS